MASHALAVVHAAGTSEKPYCVSNPTRTGTVERSVCGETHELDPGTGVAVVSLGAERVITFRSVDKSVTVKYPLASESLLYMSAVVQHGWRHAILPQPDAGGRISLTFRRLRAE